MSNNIYISFSAENSNTDAWVSELLDYFTITVGKISQVPVNIHSNLEKVSIHEDLMNESDLIVLVFNGFVSNEFSKELKFIELQHASLVNKGKEIFIVVKSGKFSSIIPFYLRKFSQYNFFEINSRTNELIDFTPLLGGDRENKFWSKLTDLAYDSKIFLEDISGFNERKFTIYLAEVSKDQAANRQILKREFLLSGYQVLPSKPLPGSFKEYQDAAQDLLKKSDVSIHIMGELYGDAPSGSDYSFPEIQNKLASEVIGNIVNRNQTGLYRFVWLPPNLEPYDEKQVQYLKRLKRELSDSKTSEILQCSIEEFKELIFQKINQIRNIKNEDISAGEKEKTLLFITDNCSQMVCGKIRNQLQMNNKKYELIDLSETGELFPLDTFRQKVKMANGAILLNSSRSVTWMHGILRLTIKNLYSGNESNDTSIAAVTTMDSKAVIDYESLNVDFVSLDDESQLLNNIDKFLNRLT